MFMC